MFSQITNLCVQLYIGAYTTSKFALEGLTRVIGPELPKHIGICSMWPGAQETKMTSTAEFSDEETEV